MRGPRVKPQHTRAATEVSDGGGRDGHDGGGFVASSVLLSLVPFLPGLQAVALDALLIPWLGAISDGVPSRTAVPADRLLALPPLTGISSIGTALGDGFWQKESEGLDLLGNVINGAPGLGADFVQNGCTSKT